jgi:hypothetical protein
MAAFGKLKRGSVQLQRAAIKASGKLDTLNYCAYATLQKVTLSGMPATSIWNILISDDAGKNVRAHFIF